MRKKVSYVFLCCIILFVLCFSVHSKFQNSYSVKSKTQIAKYALYVVYEDMINIDNLNDDEYIYEFSVKNFNENLVSDVILEYDIEFELSQENAPIKIELLDENGENISLLSNKTVEKENLELGKIEKKYIAKISYDKSSNELMNENLEIKINIKSIQEREDDI